MAAPSTSRPDHAVREAAASRPRLRADLRWSCRELQGETVYLLEDPTAGTFFHLGEREYRFANRLDGRRSLREAVARLSAGGEEALHEAEAAGLVRRFTEAGLMESSGADHGARVREHRETGRDSQWILQRVHGLLFWRIPLANPDGLLGRAESFLRPVPGLAFAVLWSLAVLAGLWALAAHWGRFVEEAGGCLQLRQAPLIAILWVALKACHEFCHGWVCKRFGGSVPETGVTLLLLVTPLGYVDASSSLRFPRKWQRIMVAAAGMLGEIFLASLAVIVWARTDPGATSHVLVQIVLIASVTTVLFNANPLMRFDGYYILSDILELPNLYGKGQQVASWLLRRWVLGVRQAPFPLGQGEPAFFIGIYGVAAAIWRVLVVVGLLLAASLLFQGAGLLLTLLAGSAMLAGWVRASRDYFAKRAASEGASWGRIALRLSAMALVAAGVLFVEVHPAVRTVGVVESIQGGHVRAQCPGFVREIVVRNGQEVAAGDLLVRLENPQERVRLETLRLEADQSRRRIDLYFHQEELAAWKAERRNLEALEERIGELEDWVASLELTAPIAGRVFSRRLGSLQGTFVRKGEEVVSVVGDDDKHLRLLVPQDQLDVATAAQGRPFRFRAMGSRLTATSVLDEVRPRATLTAPHPGLTTAAGGPLVVRHRPEASGEAGQGEERSFDLVEPHFPALASLAPEERRRLREGQLVYCRLASPRTRPLWSLASSRLQRAIRGLRAE